MTFPDSRFPGMKKRIWESTPYLRRLVVTLSGQLSTACQNQVPVFDLFSLGCLSRRTADFLRTDHLYDIIASTLCLKKTHQL